MKQDQVNFLIIEKYIILDIYHPTIVRRTILYYIVLRVILSKDDTLYRTGRLYLNRQVITLLSGLGIPDEVFLGLQEKMLLDIADMLLYDEVALLALSEVSFLFIKSPIL